MVTNPVCECIFLFRHSRNKDCIFRVGRIPGPCFASLQKEVTTLIVIKPVAEEFQISRVCIGQPADLVVPEHGVIWKRVLNVSKSSNARGLTVFFELFSNLQNLPPLGITSPNSVRLLKIENAEFVISMPFTSRMVL